MIAERFEGLKSCVDGASAYHTDPDKHFDRRYSIMGSAISSKNRFHVNASQDASIAHYSQRLTLDCFAIGDQSRAYKLQQLVQELIDNGLVSVTELTRDYKPVGPASLPEKWGQKEVISLHESLSSLSIHVGEGDPMGDLHFSENGHSYSEDEVPFELKLQTDQPIIAPFFDIPYTFRARLSTSDGHQYTLTFKELPEDFNFKELAELAYLAYSLIPDAQFVESLRTQHANTPRHKETLKILRHIHEGPLKPQDFTVGLDIWDDKVVPGSNLASLLANQDIDSAIATVRTRYEALLETQGEFFQAFVDSFTRYQEEKRVSNPFHPHTPTTVR